MPESLEQLLSVPSSRGFSFSSVNRFEVGGNHNQGPCKYLSVQEIHKHFHVVFIKITGKLKNPVPRLYIDLGASEV